MPVEDIIQSYTKLQQTKTQDVLQGIQRIGKLTWTEKGELYDVNSNSIMEGTDIQSPQREVASTSAIKDENRDVKPSTKKRKIEVDTDYTYDDDDDDSEETLVGSDSTTDDDDDEDDESTPEWRWVFQTK